MVDPQTNATEGDPAGPPKTAKQLEKEKQKLAKLEKFKQKQEKKNVSAPGEVKEKIEVSFSSKMLHFLIVRIPYGLDFTFYNCQS